VRRWTGGRHPDLCPEAYATVAKSPPVVGTGGEARGEHLRSVRARGDGAPGDGARGAPSFNLASQRPVLLDAEYAIVVDEEMPLAPVTSTFDPPGPVVT